MNPLFPHEAGHELAATQTHPLDTVLSLSREMVTAVCQVLGAEPLEGAAGGRLDHLRYPAQPASSAYRPTSTDIARVVLGELQAQQKRALDIATLSNRPEISVKVDGHDIVTRHLAILAPFLTVIDQPAEMMAEAATRMLLERIAGEAGSKPRAVTFPGKLIVRSSVAEPKTGSRKSSARTRG